MIALAQVGSVQPQLSDVPRIRPQLMTFHALDDVRQRGIGGAREADLPALAHREAVEVFDLRAPALLHVLAHRGALPGGDMLQSEPIRRFSTRLGSEAIRVGQAHGYQLEEILHLPPETIARAGEGDEAAMRACDDQRFKDGSRTSSEQRPSMGQDMQKGRRTEIEFLNGFVVREGEKVGLSCSANAVLTDIVKRVERSELSPDPRHITELRLN